MYSPKKTWTRKKKHEDTSSLMPPRSGTPHIITLGKESHATTSIFKEVGKRNHPMCQKGRRTGNTGNSDVHHINLLLLPTYELGGLSLD